MYVNVPRYGRRKKRIEEQIVKHGIRQEGHSKAATEGRLARMRFRNPSMTYAKVVFASNNDVEVRRNYQPPHLRATESHSLIQLEVSEGERGKYTDAWVGRLKNLGSFERVDEDLPWELGVNVAPKYIGDDMVLLLGLSDSKAEEITTAELQHGTTPFYSLQKWNLTMRSGHRLVWVQCWGVPLEVWDIGHLRKLVAAVGDLIEVDDDVEELRRMDRARILIKTPWKPFLQHSVVAHIGGETHLVQIVEEGSSGNGTRAPSRRRVTDSSEEIDSDDDVSETWRTAVESSAYSQLAPNDIDGDRPVDNDDNQLNLLPDDPCHVVYPAGITHDSRAYLPSLDTRVKPQKEIGKKQDPMVQPEIDSEVHVGEGNTCESPKRKDMGSRVPKGGLGITDKEGAVAQKGEAPDILEGADISPNGPNNKFNFESGPTTDVGSPNHLTPSTPHPFLHTHSTLVHLLT